MGRERWIIKSEKKGFDMVCIFLSILLGVGIVLWIREDYSDYGSLTSESVFLFMMAILFEMLLVRWDISISRTLILSKEGCEIVIFKYRKFYQWSDLVVKRLEDERDKNIYKRLYDEGVLFAPFMVRKPKRLSIMSYCFMIHPLVCFFVYFFPTDIDKYPQRSWETFAVEKSDFIYYMNLWKVKIEGLNDKID